MKKMKTFILAILFSTLFIWNAKAQISYHIFGTIDRTDVNKIAILKGRELLDSSFVKDGSFDIMGNYKTQTIVKLIFVTNKRLVQNEIILDNGDYNVTIDSNSKFNIATTSINQNLLKNWYSSDEQKANKKAKDSLLTDYKLQVDKGNYNLSAQYLVKYLTIQLNFLNYCKKFANDHHDCYAVPYLLKDESILTKENFGATFDQLSPEVKNNGWGPYLKSLLEKKRTSELDWYQHYFSLFGCNTIPFDSKLLDGKNFNQASLKGKWILLDFWASWCAPCRAEFPFLKNAYDQFKNKNFVISSVSIDKDTTAWRKALLEDNMQEFIQTNIVDFDKSEAFKHFQVYAIPTNFLVNPEGRIIALDLRGDELIKMLTRLIN